MRSENRSMIGSPDRRLVSDRVHDTEHILGAMADLAHQQALPFLALLAFGNVLDGADATHSPSVAPDALKIGKPVSFQPADFATASLNPVVMRVGRGISWV
jgi:hypothetical protein